MRPSLGRVVALALVVASLAACQAEEARTGGGPEATAGAPDEVTILGATSDQHRHIRSLFAEWADESGIEVTYEPSSSFEEVARKRIEGGKPPDILLVPQPGLLADFAARGWTRDLEREGVFERGDLDARLHDGLLDLGLVDDELHGVPLSINLKSLVWYPIEPFERAGYEPPRTWRDLVALTDRIRTEQRGAPWCVGIEDGGATGWVATDWIEDLLIRASGLDVYDEWVAGRTQFDSRHVRTAFEMFHRLVLRDGNALGGRKGIVSTTFPDAIPPMLRGRPECWMQKQGSFIIGSFPKAAEFGTDYGVFYFPPAPSVGGYGGRPVVGGGDIAALVTDDPAAREVLRFMTTPEWFGRSRAHEGGTLSAFVDFDPADYPHAVDGELAQILERAGAYRFDGSDSMPAEVGAGAFWTEATAWIAGRQGLGKTVRRIDEAWPSG